MKRVFSFLVFVLFSLVASAQIELKMITLQHRFPQDILPTVQSMVGVEGSASAVQNFLLIHATPERMAQIEQVIAALDTEQKNVRITVSHDDSVYFQRSLVDVAGRMGNVELLVPGGAPNGVQVNIGQTESRASKQGEEFVTVLDGQRAFIRVGESVPYTLQWIYLMQRYLRTVQTTEFHDITTGFAVRPRYIGNQVEIEVTPRIVSRNTADWLDFVELSTVVRILPGQWFDLGGAMQSKDEVSRLILGRQQERNTSKNSLIIKVD